MSGASYTSFRPSKGTDACMCAHREEISKLLKGIIGRGALGSSNTNFGGTGAHHRSCSFSVVKGTTPWALRY